MKTLDDGDRGRRVETLHQRGDARRDADRLGGSHEQLLIRAADRLAPVDAALARDLYLEALSVAISSGRPRERTTVAEAARSAPRPATSRSRSPRPGDLLLDALVVRCLDGYPAGVAAARRALRAFTRCGRSEEAARWWWLALRLAADQWDGELWSRRSATTGPGGDGPPGSDGYGSDELLATMNDGGTRWLVGLCPPRAPLDEVRATSLTHYARAVLANGLGRYDVALTAARQSCVADDLGVHGWALAEVVESASRCLEHDVAADALGALTDRVTASGTEWAHGCLARARALTSTGTRAEGHYREAIERLQVPGAETDLARTRLLYGEWLRREHRRLDARHQLRQARAVFADFGAPAFAARADRELEATGETVRKRTVTTCVELTAQERHIARLAGRRLTNSEIASQLFISPRTVEWHLHKVFMKLGVTSRRELGFARL